MHCVSSRFYNHGRNNGINIHKVLGEGNFVLTVSEGSFAAKATSFYDFSWDMGEKLSNPSIIVKAQHRDGRIIKIDDYREAYWWLRDNTPEDARIMANHSNATTTKLYDRTGDTVKIQEVNRIDI